MILVTVSTGHLGKAALDQLLKNIDKENLVVFAREKEKAQQFIEQGGGALW